MGNCVSSQGQSSALEKQAAAARSSHILSSRKAAMEKYPVPTKCRLAAGADDAGGEKRDSSPSVSSTTQLRSKLRPPSVTLARPLSIPSSKTGIDTNGNIPRPSSLPRLLKNEPAGVTSSANSRAPQVGAAKRSAPARTASLDCKNRTALNQSSTSSDGSCGKDSNKTASPVSKDSHMGSISPSLSTLSVTSSVGSNKSNSVADSGIASSSQRSPTLAEKKSALSLRFGFYSQRKAAGVAQTKKAAVDRFNSAAASQLDSATIAAPVYSKVRIQQHQQQRAAGLQRPSYRLAGRQMSAETTASKVLPTPQLALIKDRAAQVLSRGRSGDYRPVELRPRLSVEAIVASLEQEVRHQLGPELPPLPPIERPKSDDAALAKTLDVEHELRQHLRVERFGLEPGKAEMTYVESGSDGLEDDDDLIEDIELQLQTPSSAADHQGSPDGDGRSHHGDEEDSAATSISDAMIDDEIADQPGLVMLGQSASVPASPSHSWRTALFEYTLPPMSVIPYPPPADEDSSESSAAYHRLVRRRVASVSHIDAGLKASAAGSDSAVVTGSSTPAERVDEANMRAELFGSPAPRHPHASGIWTQPESAILIELDEYAAMANELADIKAQLVTLQELLVDADLANADDAGQQSAPLWDLKRDLVLLREELQEKNTTIKSLKNELKAAAGRSVNNKAKEASCKSSVCNVATQTDRPRNGTIGNGLSPCDSNEDGQLVSIKKKLAAPSGLPVRSRPLPVKMK